MYVVFKKMKRLFTLILLLQLAPLMAQESVHSVLQRLDQKIDERYIYNVEKERRINALKFNLSNSRDDARSAQLSHSLFEEYKTYQYDSAYVYALRVSDYAELGTDTNAIAQSQCDLLYCYSTAGFFREGGDIINNFSTEGVSQPILANFYRGSVLYYFNLMRYVGDTQKLSDTYREKMLENSALALENLPQDSFDYKFTDIQRCTLLVREGDNCIERINELLTTPNLSLNKKAILYSWLGMGYNDLSEIDQAIYYTALSAISDIESCTYETTSARELAGYMYEMGDINRASKYINLALSDANFYNVPYRKLEVQSIMPTISGKRLSNIEEDWRFLVIVSAIIMVLLVIIVAMFVNIRRQNKALRRARTAIEEHANKLLQFNEKLSLLNGELSEANQIKDQYIIESLYSDTDFVDIVEKMCRVLIRKIKAKQYTELLDLVGSINIKRERQRMSSTFDAAFLKLFPNFIEEYNKLFDADNASTLGANNELSPEIRIFALIRLGIDDVNLIAKYLNLSLNTVYVYKAKVKARTIVAKEEFEEHIKAIKQPY